MARRLTDAEKAQREADRKAARDAYIKRILDDWPPLTQAQIDLIARLLHPGVSVPQGPRQPSAYELEQRRKEAERANALKEAKKLALSLTECDACNLQPEAHAYQKGHGMGFHDWVPGRAQKILNAPK